MGILSIFKGKKNILYYPGCLTKFVLKQEADNYRKILQEIGIDFIMLPNEACCGSPALNAGYESDAIKLARQNLKLFKEHNVGKIITNCPACYKTFLDYKEMLLDWDIEIEHMATTLFNKMKGKGMYIVRETVTYHDPCHLGRKSGIYEEPRKVLELLGYNLVEMKNNRRDSFCCGGGAGLKVNSPSTASKIAKKRIEQAKNIGAKKIITTCPLCFSHMGENSDIEIVEFSYAIADALGLYPKKTEIMGAGEKKEVKVKEGNGEKRN